MGNGSSKVDDTVPRNFEFKCSFMLNGGRMDCVPLEIHNPDKNTRIPKDKRHLIQQCLNHFSQPIIRAGRDTMKENTDWNSYCKATQIVLCWAWLIGGLFTGLGAGLLISDLLVVGILGLVVYTICVAVLPFYLLPKYDALYEVFMEKVENVFENHLNEYRALLEPGFTVRFYKRDTDPPQIVEAMDKTPPWVTACVITGLTVWVIPFVIVITNFCCLRCFPKECITYEIEVKFDVEAAKAGVRGQPMMQSQPQQAIQMGPPIQAAMAQSMGMQPGIQPANVQPAAQPMGMAQSMMPGMPGGMPLMTPEQYQHYFNSMMAMHAQNQGASGVAVPPMAMQMGVAEMEVVTSEGEGGEGAAPPAYGGHTHEMPATGTTKG